MYAISSGGEYELVVNKSRFICALARVDTLPAAREFVATRRKQHYDARHHCSAFALGDDAQIMRSSDDGEPSGTAGVPMLEVIKHRQLTNTAAVVTRYFGGVKLGAGGLIRAYGAAVAGALDQVKIVRRQQFQVASIALDHGTAGRLEAEFRRGPYRVLDVRYDAKVHIDIAVAETKLNEFAQWLGHVSSGAGEYQVTGMTVLEL